jgi:hypothetical protein
MNRISSVDAPIRLIRIFKEQDAGQSTSAHGLLIETWPARAPNWFDQKRSEASRGGARRDRTDDLLLAKQALSQLSYGPESWIAITLRRRSASPTRAELGGHVVSVGGSGRI